MHRSAFFTSRVCSCYSLVLPTDTDLAKALEHCKEALFAEYPALRSQRPLYCEPTTVNAMVGYARGMCHAQMISLAHEYLHSCACAHPGICIDTRHVYPYMYTCSRKHMHNFRQPQTTHAARNRQDPAMCSFSSGTTGRAKVNC